MKFYKVANTQAPQQLYRRNQGTWKPLMQGMRQGEWFLVEKAKKANVQSAAFAYCKGRYSLYMHPSKKDVYVFKINKN
tara:strand:+ start:222 stop:455 length:234 start_codon:yes stop_codon:yes gene_type:complete